MISIITFLIGLFLTGIYAKRQYVANVIPSSPGRRESINVRYFVIIGACVIGSIIGAVYQPYSIERIDAGCVGLKINLVGADRGLSQYQYKTGWVPYNVYTEQIVEIPVSQQHVEYDGTVAIAKGGFNVTIAPSFNYEVIATSAGDMFITLRKGLEQIQNEWLKTAAIGGTNDVVNRWSVDDIFNKRELFEAEVMAEINKRVGKWFTLSQIRTNITPPKSLQDAINAKTTAIQDAQAAQALNQVIEMQNLNKIMEARGDSAQRVIEASSVAEAMRIKKQEITPLYVEYLKVTNWDGKNPTTLVTDGSSTAVMVK